MGESMTLARAHYPGSNGRVLEPNSKAVRKARSAIREVADRTLAAWTRFRTRNLIGRTQRSTWV